MYRLQLPQLRWSREIDLGTIGVIDFEVVVTVVTAITVCDGSCTVRDPRCRCRYGFSGDVDGKHVLAGLVTLVVGGVAVVTCVVGGG